MITIRLAESRGHIRTSFIDTRRTFSFPPYNEPNYTNYSNLQTINDDRVQYQWQVPWHEHKNMEIFGYVVEGSSHHVDSLGNDVEVPAGAIQRMSAGKSIWHTEGNTSNIPNRYLQLWIRPNVQDVEPKHDYYCFTREDKLNKFCDVTEKLPINADARLLAGIFTQEYTTSIDPNRKYYAYIVLGSGQISNNLYIEGDGFMFEDECSITINPEQESEIILFDLI